MRRKIPTRMGIVSTTNQAPWVNLLRSRTPVTTAVMVAPRPFTRALDLQPRLRSLHQCTTIPVWERVKLRNTPTA